ncbi:hybrid signal transduction histidine kinase A-like [Lucilia cuprina]|uniref:hybrid signal transduction histidine kinase A-like n=1 Tax=Lucilia cuprina TaxID=7375 RepID=UPI001F068E31|nr:hybrid signal transduction histidine kinase A-like [Lucilia cuprina]XP_046803965.1 hybrid signal transduction histidine kinase A-like [Lucilia cuprina]XP_046803968.1 hybrid signal transduction histidine kinase A-like [Lucilia cuprina]
MFYDLLTRNSNEYFYQGPAGRKKGERAKHEHEAEEKEFINFFSKQQQNTFGPQETRQKLERAANKMAVNKKKQTIMMASQDEHEESKDKKTPSLEQEMNLARRACWCNNNLDDLKGQQQEQQIKQKCCENCFKRLNKDNKHDNDNVNEKENVINEKNEENDDDDDDDDDDEEDDDVNETTVLNGAKNFSKNINKLNKTTNNDNTNTTTTTTTINSNSKMFSNTNTNTTTNSLSKRKNLINKHKMETGNETTTISSSSTISKDAAANNSSVSDSASFPTTINNNATNCNNSLSNNNNNNNFTAYLRVVLLQLWLAFVEFCDKNTIKKNDPRFAPYRPTDQKQDQQKSQQQQQQNSTPNNSSSTKAKKPFQFKLLTNKKIIFLFIVCVFFSCVNRIEARPNLESSNNAIVGEASPGVVASSNDGGANVKAMDNSVSGKSNVSPYNLKLKKLGKKV